jgi:hypothetical protein
MGLEIVWFLARLWIVSAFHFFCEVDASNGFVTWSSFKKVLFSSSYSMINPDFTARKRMGVWSCHETRVHQKTTIFTSIVYGRIFWDGNSDLHQRESSSSRILINKDLLQRGSSAAKILCSEDPPQRGSSSCKVEIILIHRGSYPLVPSHDRWDIRNWKDFPEGLSLWVRPRLLHWSFHLLIRQRLMSKMGEPRPCHFYSFVVAFLDVCGDRLLYSKAVAVVPRKPS